MPRLPATILADAYLHRLDPWVIQFTDTLGVRWYGLAYVAAFLIGWLFLRWMAKTGRSPMSVRDVGDLMLPAILGVLIGGRLGYCLFYEPHLWVDFSSRFPFWGVLRITGGGMSSHGGMIGVILACGWFAHRRKISALHLLDLGAFACTIGFFLGRIANFINAELWGRPLPETMQDNPPWWSVKYPTEITRHWLPASTNDPELSDEFMQRIAMDFHITAANTTELRELVAAESAERLRDIEAQLRPALGLGDRFYTHLLDAARDASDSAHHAVVETIRPLLTAYYPSQLIQMMTDGLLLTIILAVIWWKPRKPGVIGASWLVLYGVFRILSEQFRQPDLGVETILGFSRGQQLSILMVLAGIVALFVVSRRDVARVGGLLKRGSAVGVESTSTDSK